MPKAEAVDIDDLLAQLDVLRASGAADRDPVRFAYLDALTRRASGQTGTVRQSLIARINAGIAELVARPAPILNQPEPENTISPLADLLSYINRHAHELPDAANPISEMAGERPDNQRNSKRTARAASRRAPELKSVAFFHNSWSKLSTEQQLSQTLAHAPENAGPMNSQHLVLRSLQLMRDLSPDYLQGFMSYIDTLIWLDHTDPTKRTTGRSSGGEKPGKPRAEKP